MGSKQDNIQLVEKAGLLPHEHCAPYLSHVKGNKNSKVDVLLTKADQCLSLKLPGSKTNTERRVKEDTRRGRLESFTKEAMLSIIESRRPFEQAIAEKKSKLELLDSYTSVFSDNKVAPLKDLPLGVYNVMAMREAQTQFGLKYIMLVDIDSKGTLGVCYSNKSIEDFLLKNLCDEKKVEIREPKRNYLTLYNKPLATLTIPGWGRTEQRNAVVYCNIRLEDNMGAHSIKQKKEEIKDEIENLRVKLREAMEVEGSGGRAALPLITREREREHGTLQASSKPG